MSGKNIFTIIAIVILCCLTGGLFVLYNAYISGATQTTLHVYRERETIVESLHYDSITTYSEEELEAVGVSVFNALQRGIIHPLEVGNALCPPVTVIYAMVASEEYIRQKGTLFAQEKGFYGDFYRKMLVVRPTAIMMRRRYDVLFQWYSAWCADDLYRSRPSPIASQGTFEAPRGYRLRQGHQTALDLFFLSVEKYGNEEIGPPLYSHTAGVVIAAAEGWDDNVHDVQGGLSPHSGNGVVVYDPFSERMYFYFHLHDIAVSTGQIIQSGTLIGRGGNTGINARKPNKGEHVHVEIYDCRKNEFFSVYEIKEQLYDQYYQK